MSLRARILLLFIAFSLLPMAFLGIGDYLHSLEALRAVVEARNEVVAEQVARDVSEAYARFEAELLEAARGPEAPAGAFTRVAPVDPAAPLVGPDCGAPGVIPVRASLPAGGDPGAAEAVEGHLPVETLVARVPGLGSRMGYSGFTQLLDRESGTVLFDSRCRRPGGGAGRAAEDGPDSVAPAVAAAAASLGDGPRRPISTRYRAERQRLIAAVTAAGPRWAVAVHTAPEEYVVPFARSRLLYLALGILVVVVVAGVFLLVAGNAFRSLGSVISAADQIGLGNMRPWLPPPGDDEVGRLSLAFRRMIDRLEDSIRQSELNQKLAAVGGLATYLSHEIRNPLSSIRLSLQSLHRDLAAGFIPHDSARVIEIALGEVKRLDGVVRAVLEMGRPAEPASDRTCHAHDTLAETLDVLRPKVRAQGIELEYAPRAASDVVVGDADGLRSVVINLVVNAIDALEGVRDARIRISTWSGGAGELHIRIADNGPGVPPRLADSIFEPFFTTKVGGNGIGLPTALRTVQPWNGTIVHEPVAAGTGAVFIIRLKLADPPRAEPAPEDTLATAQAS